jgi:hypothetical protein
MDTEITDQVPTALSAPKLLRAVTDDDPTPPPPPPRSATTKLRAVEDRCDELAAA